RERDRAFDDEAADSLSRERGHEFRVAVVAGGRLVERPQEPLGRIAGAGRVEVHSEGLEDLGDGAPVAGPILRVDLPLRELGPVGTLQRRFQLDHVVTLSRHIYSFCRNSQSGLTIQTKRVRLRDHSYLPSPRTPAAGAPAATGSRPRRAGG